MKKETQRVFKIEKSDEFDERAAEIIVAQEPVLTYEKLARMNENLAMLFSVFRFLYDYHQAKAQVYEPKLGAKSAYDLSLAEEQEVEEREGREKAANEDIAQYLATFNTEIDTEASMKLLIATNARTFSKVFFDDEPEDPYHEEDVFRRLRVLPSTLLVKVLTYSDFAIYEHIYKVRAYLRPCSSDRVDYGLVGKLLNAAYKANAENIQEWSTNAASIGSKKLICKPFFLSPNDCSILQQLNRGSLENAIAKLANTLEDLRKPKHPLVKHLLSLLLLHD